MALLSRVVLACNRCGKEFYNATSNLTVMGEEFYLCDKCMDGLLEYISTKTVAPETEEKKPTLSYMIWDTYNLDKLVMFKNQGKTQPEMAKEFGTSIGSIGNIIHRIRNSTPGSTLYAYRKCFVEED